MDVDGTQAELEHASQDTKEVSNVLEDVGTSKASNGDSKGPVPPRGTTGKEDLGVPDTDILYPIFWSLQQTFSSPTRLFDTAIFRDFKNGLNLSIAKFSEVQKSLDGRVASRVIEDSRRGIKRKRNDGEDELASGFNPKYLTSRDLFELEISDLAFRRHFLVQALILLDFLLSLTAKAKAKLVDPNLTNKSVLYQYTLGDDDAKWVIDTRTTIATYLQEGPEGKFYYRMVDTVLSRDKNWVKWKAENCPPIERAALSSQDWSGAKDAAEKACGPRRLRVTPMGALDLSFLSEAEGQDGLEKLEDTQRFAVPDIKSFEAGIAEDEFDIGMARSEEDKQLAINAKASKTWRVLRIASKSRLNLFDKIDGNAQNLRPLFEPESDDGKAKDDGMADAPEIQHEDEGSSAATGAAPVAEMQESVEPGGAEASATAAVPASSFGDGGRVAPHDGP
ncbi:MAG: hypothetical protein M1832_003551 [Thelocarpon impressellum]|nr:MAG: hypothetical protein M1832_003551 [Thelocarpon impressellum]